MMETTWYEAVLRDGIGNSASVKGGVRAQFHACHCIGPKNGDPVCPCQMPEYLRRKRADAALAILERMVTKPRIRVKAGRRVSEPTSIAREMRK